MLRKIEITSAGLHVFAMLSMLVDHIGVVFAGPLWMRQFGRLAFPIFAFMVVEGYFHTSDLRKYIRRMSITALLTEIPFDLVFYGVPFYWQYQNVMFTFLISILLIYLCEHMRKTSCFSDLLLIVVAGVMLPLLVANDYGHVGVLTVLLFYLARGREWYHYLIQLAGMILLHCVFRSGIQWFAVFALLPVWLYRGTQGYKAKWFQYVCYGFYPCHLAVLALL